MEAGFAEAAREVHLVEGAVLERIGRLGTNPNDLRMLVQGQIVEKVWPGPAGMDGMRQLADRVLTRLREAGPSPTSDPASERLNESQGARTLEFAYNNAARYAEQIAPAVREVVGRARAQRP